MHTHACLYRTSEVSMCCGLLLRVGIAFHISCVGLQVKAFLNLLRISVQPRLQCPPTSSRASSLRKELFELDRLCSSMGERAYAACAFPLKKRIQSLPISTSIQHCGQCNGALHQSRLRRCIWGTVQLMRNDWRW